MFEGVIERKSHENGLLASFSGSSPALGSIMILQNSEDYVGKVDSVLCNADDPLIHIAHLDFKADIDAMIGQKILIRRREPEKVVAGKKGSLLSYVREQVCNHQCYQDCISQNIPKITYISNAFHSTERAIS